MIVKSGGGKVMKEARAVQSLPPDLQALFPKIYFVDE